MSRVRIILRDAASLCASLKEARLGDVAHCGGRKRRKPDMQVVAPSNCRGANDSEADSNDLVGSVKWLERG